MRALLAVAAVFAAVSAVTAGQANAEPPALIFESATPSYVTAQVTGTLDPKDHDATWNFQYSANPATEGWFDGPHWKAQTLPAGSGPTPVSEELHEVFGCCPNFGPPLKPGTTYKVRLWAQTSEGEFASPVGEFTTLPVEPPEIFSAGNATNIANTTADAAAVVTRGTDPSDPATNLQCTYEYISFANYLPRNEKVRLTVKSKAGTFVIGVGIKRFVEGHTGQIPFNASAATVQAALEAVPEIGSGNVQVTGGPGSATGLTPYVITFVGALANTNIEGVFAEGINVEGGEVGTEPIAQGHPEGFEAALTSPCNPNGISTPGNTAVTGELKNMTPNTSYHLRLVVKNAGGSDTQVLGDFKTAAVATVQTLEASTTSSSAILGGRINPANAPNVYQFEWGTDTSYGNAVPVPPQALTSADEQFHVVTAQVVGLSPGTQYHYRVVAVNTQSGQEVKGPDRLFTTRPLAPPASSCPNAASRIGPSANLPDCRAYELASVGMNNGAISIYQGIAGDDGAIVFRTIDVPLDTEGGFGPVISYAISRRGPDGWATKSLFPPSKEQANGFQTTEMGLVSTDLSESVVFTPQKLDPTAGPGANYYLRRADGSYVRLSNVGNPGTQVALASVQGASLDFRHIFFNPTVKQFETDPEGQENTYEWFDGTLRPVGVLPDGTVAGGSVVGRNKGISADGSRALFTANGMNGRLFMRVNGSNTIEVSESKRTVEPDPEPFAGIGQAQINQAGTKVFFISKSELTNDAYTGRSGGAQNHQGADLYVYDTVSGTLTDLTVDNEAADAETGANVQAIAYVSNDSSYVYFTATGKLAPGGVSGQPNLYVEHNGQIVYVSPAPHADGAGRPELYGTPDGTQVAFASDKTLTAFDNNGLSQIYKYTYGGRIECASCRPDGTLPQKPSAFGDDNSFLGSRKQNHFISDDGRRIFFESEDSILPGATNGLYNVYEYEDGQVHLISPGDGATAARLLDASPSGNDVYFVTHEALAQKNEGGNTSVYDARVNADPFVPAAPECQGEGCRGAASSAPGSPTPGSSTFEAPGRISVGEAKAVAGSSVRLRVIAPGSGTLSVAGKGLKPTSQKVTQAGPTILTVKLKPSANRKRQAQGGFRTRAEVLFRSGSGEVSRADVQLRFKPSKGKTRKPSKSKAKKGGK